MLFATVRAMINVPACIIALSLACVAGGPVSSVNAQPNEAAHRPLAAQAASATKEVGCGAGAAIYWAGSGPKVQVLRRGKVRQENPLRPSSEAAPALVVEVNINGKIATALGESFETMRRAGPPKQVEEESGTRIEWDAKLVGLPTTILILSEDGPEVVARLQFTECGRAPKPARRRDLTGKAKSPNPPSPRSSGETSPPIPQGAIQ
jgi:hypothetical protein